MTVALVGESAHGLGELTKKLTADGLDAKEGNLTHGDKVLFCVSVRQGVGESLFDELERCVGFSLVPVAIVLTQGDDSLDSDLFELVYYEMREVLEDMIPSQQADALEILRGDDVNFPVKVKQSLGKNTTSVTFKGLNRGAFRRYADKYNKPKKPWWKFW